MADPPERKPGQPTRKQLGGWAGSGTEACSPQYRHFGSKKRLYLALFTKHEEDLPTLFEGGDLVDPERVVRGILERWLDYVRENPHGE
jgi:hypothetical protein